MEEQRGAAEPRLRWAALAAPAGWIALYSLIAAGLQSLATYPPDGDTAVHFAIASMMRAHGPVLHSFPWTAFSWHSVNHADTGLMLHLAYMPLLGLGYATATQVVGALLGTAFLVVIYLVLRAEKVPLAGVWPLVALASSSYFMQRFLTVRPHLFGVALALVVAWAAARRRLRVLALASFLYPFGYMAIALVPLLALAAEAARRVSGARPDWRPPAMATACVAAGTLAHPNFPAILQLSSYIRDVLSQVWQGSQAQFDLGSEFEPFSWGELVACGAVPFALAAAAVILTLWRRRERPVAVAFGLTTLFFGLLTARSQRFIEYLPAFATVGLALGLQAALRSERAVSRLGLGLLAVNLLWTGTLGHEVIARVTRVGDSLPAPAASRLRSLVPEGETVFTCGWGETGQLMLALPERRFMVALDPNYFWKFDPGLYQRWYSLTHLSEPRPVGGEILTWFGTRYVMCPNDGTYAGFIASLDADPQVRLSMRTRFWALYVILPAPAPR